MLTPNSDFAAVNTPNSTFVVPETTKEIPVKIPGPILNLIDK
jgi:hypothetical protein